MFRIAVLYITYIALLFPIKTMSCTHLYSPFLACALPKHPRSCFCTQHTVAKKRQEDCSVCLTPLESGKKTILLGCAHMFHVKCLSSWITPNCPLCRYELTVAECRTVYSSTVIRQLVTCVYSLPATRVLPTLQCIGYIIDISQSGEDNAEVLLDQLKIIRREL